MKDRPVYKYTITKESEILTFGKHKHETIQHILRVDPGYVLWLDEEKIVKFPGEIITKAVELRDDMSFPKMNHNYSFYFDDGDWDEQHF